MEPTPTTQHVTYQITIVNTNDRFELINARYYEHLYDNYDIARVDFTDKSSTTSLEIQVRVAELPILSKRKPDVLKESVLHILYETISPKKLILYNLTLHHDKNTLLIQGNLKLEWVNKKLPLLKAILK